MVKAMNRDLGCSNQLAKWPQMISIGIGERASKVFPESCSIRSQEDMSQSMKADEVRATTSISGPHLSCNVRHKTSSRDRLSLLLPFKRTGQVKMGCGIGGVTLQMSVEAVGVLADECPLGNLQTYLQFLPT
jgi:hypothetical protein